MSWSVPSSQTPHIFAGQQGRRRHEQTCGRGGRGEGGVMSRTEAHTLPYAEQTEFAV